MGLECTMGCFFLFFFVVKIIILGIRCWSIKRFINAGTDGHQSPAAPTITPPNTIKKIIIPVHFRST